MAKKAEELPVIFRYCSDAGEPIAFFPTLPGDFHAGTFTYYVHVGQHGICSTEGYCATRKHPKTELELSDMQALKAEVRSIYEGDPDEPCRLVERQRITRRMDDERRRALAALEGRPEEGGK